MTAGAEYPRQVLIVEDEAPLRRLLSLALTGGGYTVHESAHGEAALVLLEAGVAPDVAVVDLVMPFMDGRTFLVEAARRGFLFPAVLASASPEAQTIAAELGVSQYLRKPFSVSQLLEAVARAESAA